MLKKFAKVLKNLSYDWSLAELKHFSSNTITDNISYQDSLYINLISSHPNEYTPSKIADLLGITRPSVTHRINELEKKGFIIKTQSEVDKRIFYLNISEDCEKYYQSFETEDIKVANKFIEKYSEKDLDKFCEWLNFISNEYKQVENIENIKNEGK